MSTFAADNQILLGTIDKEQQAKTDLLRQIGRLKEANRSSAELEQKHRECRQKLRESKQLLTEHEQLQQRYQERLEKLLEKTKTQQDKLLRMQLDYIDAQKKLEEARYLKTSSKHINPLLLYSACKLIKLW